MEGARFRAVDPKKNVTYRVFYRTDAHQFRLSTIDTLFYRVANISRVTLGDHRGGPARERGYAKIDYRAADAGGPKWQALRRRQFTKRPDGLAIRLLRMKLIGVDQRSDAAILL